MYPAVAAAQQEGRVVVVLMACSEHSARKNRCWPGLGKVEARPAPTDIACWRFVDPAATAEDTLASSAATVAPLARFVLFVASLPEKVDSRAQSEATFGMEVV